MAAKRLQLLGILQKIRLVAHHDLGPPGQLRRIILQLLVDGIKVRQRVPALAAGDVHQVHKQAAPVNMPQEVVAQTGALAGPLNDAGNIRHDEADTVVYIYNAQIGIEGGKSPPGPHPPGASAPE